MSAPILAAVALLVAARGAPVPASPQEAPGAPIPVVPGFVHDGDLSEWRGGAAPRELPTLEGAPQVLVWVGQVEGGLAVAAEVRGAAAGGRVPIGLEVTLADGTSAALPPIGWGHQFGFETLPNAAACEELAGPPGGDAAACREWYERERAARERMLALFERRWQIDVAETATLHEDRARPAFDALRGRRSRAWAALEPGEDASVRMADVAGTDARGVELFVPWRAFPPVRGLALSAVRLRIARADAEGVGGGGGAADDRRAATAPSQGRWTRRPLARPWSTSPGACGLGPASVVIQGPADELPRFPSDSAVLYMRPDPTGPARLVTLDNEARGYQYEPDSTLVSPVAYEVEYPSIRVGPKEWLCGPVLSYRRGERVSATVDSTRAAAGPAPPARAPVVDLRHVETRREADGAWLVREGPIARWSPFGSGQCGACPRVSLRVWRIDPASARIVELFGYHEIAEPEARDIEIEPSAAWDSITVFESRVDRAGRPPDEPPATIWSATRYCRDPADPSAPYAVCGEREDVPEPPARLRRAYAEPGAR